MTESKFPAWLDKMAEEEGDHGVATRFRGLKGMSNEQKLRVLLDVGGTAQAFAGQREALLQLCDDVGINGSRKALASLREAIGDAAKKAAAPEDAPGPREKATPKKGVRPTGEKHTAE